jgi:hypothetical protein
MRMKKFESFGKETLEDLVEKTYDSQNLQLSSHEISFILRSIKNNIDRLKSKNMMRIANDKETILLNIIKKLK